MDVDSRADFAEHASEISRGRLKGIGINRERCSENNKRSAILWRSDSLCDGQATDSLNGNLDRCNNVAQLIERAGARLSRGNESAALIVSNVMDHKVAAEIF